MNFLFCFSIWEKKNEPIIFRPNSAVLKTQRPEKGHRAAVFCAFFRNWSINSVIFVLKQDEVQNAAL